MALCAIIHRFKPDMIEWEQLNPENIRQNNQLVSYSKEVTSIEA